MLQNHQIVKINDNRYFDPSYGVSNTDSIEMENDVISGYATTVIPDTTKVYCEMDLQIDGDGFLNGQGPITYLQMRSNTNQITLKFNTDDF